jgi:carboxyl-terminal processing protease
MIHFKVRKVLPPRFLAAAIGVVLLGACAGEARPMHERGTRAVMIDGLDVAMMAHVLQHGFTEIRDRALDEVSVNVLFIQALNGLSDIEPEIGVQENGERLFITYAGAPLPPLDLPRDSVEGWTRATLATILTLRQISEPMKAADEEALYKAAFPPALRLLDPFSRYSGYDDAMRLRLIREGIIGLGVRVVSVTGGAVIQSIVKDGPAETAGLKLEDVITHVDGVRLAHLSIAEIREHLEGKANTTVDLTIERGGTPAALTVTVRRDRVVPATVSAQVVDGILELRVRSFNQRTAQSVEKAVMAALENGPVKGIVMDLRSDPGGLLDQAVDLADLFLDSGTIISLRGRHPGAQQYYAARPGDIAEGIPMSVVIDGQAASAAEIVAAALQDNRRAAVVGTVSLGKGSIQTVVRLPNQGEIAITWSRAYTPRGALLHGLGVLPHVCLSGDQATLDETVTRIYDGGGLSDEAIHGWDSPPADLAGLDLLRAACPPEARPDHALDLEVARRLVLDPALFAQATQDRARQLAQRQ